MHEEWYYTKDGKNRVGPVSSSDLQALARSGELGPTDLVWKEGMAQWTPASLIKDLFTSVQPKSPAVTDVASVQVKARPTLLQSAEKGQAVIKIVSRLVLGSAVFISLLAALLAMLGFGGRTPSLTFSVLAILIGFGGVLLGLFAVGIGLWWRKGTSFLESASIAVFLGVAATLFSIGSTLAGRTILEYQDISAKADEVEQERRKAEVARRETKQLKDEVEKARDDALERPKEILRQAKETSKQNDEKLEQIKAEQAMLNAERKELDAEIKRKNDAVSRKESAAAKKSKEIQEKEFDLEKRTAMLASKEKQLVLDHKQLQALMEQVDKEKADADAARRDAVKKLQAAKAHLDKAEEKEIDAKKHYEKVMGVYDDLKEKLKVKSKSPKDSKKAAINAIERFGPLPSAANGNLRDISYRLCEIAVEDTELRPMAIDAIFNTEPKLGPVITTLMKPPDGTGFDKFVETLTELPKFGSVGLPLVQAILKKPTNADYGYWEIFVANVEVLGKVAKDDERALTILISAPNWPYAKVYEKHAQLHNKLYANGTPNPNPRAPAGWIHPPYVVGKELLEICKSNPRFQKKEEVTDYFIELSKESKSVPKKLNDENQLLAAEALGSFEADAKKALPYLKKLRSGDNSEDVRKAARDAIERIEKSK
jgi:hypothetical protein